MFFPTLSFCITCKNRFHQISQTLKNNLDDNRIHRRWVEFILVDFGSDDGLKEWVVSNFQEELNLGYLRYYYTDELTYWHASIAKNTVHLLAANQIVMNLDCDNFTGFLGGQFVIRQFTKNQNLLLHQYKGDPHDGSFGRIAIFKAYFKLVNGYNESLEPFYYEDVDLIIRLREIGLVYKNMPFEKYTRVIKNSTEESFTNIKTEYTSEEMHHENSNRSKVNVSNGYILGNEGSYGLIGNLYDHNDIKIKYNDQQAKYF